MVLTVFAAGFLALASVPAVWAAHRLAAADDTREASFWPAGSRVDGTTDRDGRAVELGLRFQSSVAGSVAGVRFYKPAEERGRHTGSLWSADGRRLATGTFDGETASGWQELRFAAPVAIRAGEVFTASYHTDNGIYLSKERAFERTGLTAGPLSAPAGRNGVYAYGAGAFPTGTWNSSNYFVDVIFRYTGTAPPPSPPPSPSASPAPPTPTATSGPPSVRPSSRPPTASPTPTGWPDASNTGVPRGTVLTPRSGSIVVRDNGAVIENIDLKGFFDVYADNVTIRRSRISAANWWGIQLRGGFTNLTIEDCEIFGDGVRQMQYGIKSLGGFVTARRNNVHTISNGIDLPEGLIEDNYVHDPKYFPDDHTDMIMSEGGLRAGGRLTIRHNTVINTLDQTGAIALFADWGPQHDVTVERNLVAGGGYSIYAGAAGSSNLRFVDNVFSRRVFPKGGHWGPVAHWNAGGSGNVWQGNRWEDGTPVNP